MSAFENLLENLLKKMTTKRLVGGFVGLTGFYGTYQIGKRSFKTVEPGHVGYVNFFGEVDKTPMLPGYHFINPLANLVQVNLRDRRHGIQSSVASREGLMIEVDISAICNLNQDQARDVYVNVGSDYEDVLLNPQMKSIIRDTVSGYDAKALYSSDSREEIRSTIMDRLKQKTEPRGIFVKDILINRIKLPNQLTTAIEEKLKAEQEMEKMNFVVQKERKEAERKAIEAEGIKKFQDIVANGVSEPLLKWKGITATEELAKSPNAKVVIIGSGQNGLPIIFNSDQTK